MRGVVFISFGAWLPDFTALAADGLDRAEGGVPSSKGYVPLQKPVSRSTVVDGPMTGCLAHSYQQEVAEQVLKAVSATLGGNPSWIPEDVDEALAAFLDPEEYVRTPANSNPLGAFEVVTDDYSTPGSTADHRYEYRYEIKGQGAAWTVDVVLFQDSIGIFAVDSLAGSGGESGIVFRRFDIDPGDASTMVAGEPVKVNYHIKTFPTSAETATTDEDITTGGWQGQDAGTTDLWNYVNDGSVSTFVQSPPLAPGGAEEKVRFGLSPLTPQELPTGVYQYRVTVVAGATQPGLEMRVKIFDGSVVLRDEILGLSTGAPQTFNLDLTAAEQALLADHELEVEIGARYPTFATATAFNTELVASTVSTGNWLQKNGGSALNTSLPIGDDTDHIEIDTTQFPIPADSGRTCRLGFNAFPHPLTGKNWTVEARLRRGSTTTSTVPVVARLLVNGVLKWTASFASPGLTFASQTLGVLEATAADLVTSTGALQLELRAGGSSTVPLHVEATEAYLKYPKPYRVRVFSIDATWPSIAHFRAWDGEFKAPGPEAVYSGDEVTLFAGSRSKLYEVTSDAFTDISKAGGYGAAGAAVAAWSMVSSGNHIVATNRQDPIQVRENNTGDFKDLHTGAETPKARFVGNFGPNLILGDINYTDHFSDEIWISNPLDIGEFDFFNTNRQALSDAQRLTDTPGQIMGIISGDPCLVLKRNSSYIVSRAAPPYLFRPQLISSVGTPFPRSVVAVGDRAMWYAGDHFYSWGYSGGFQRISQGAVSDSLRDPEGDFFTGTFPSGDILAEDLAMQGVYDHQAGVVAWFYPGAGGDVEQKSKAVLYHEASGLWGFLNNPEVKVSVATAWANTRQLAGYMPLATLFQFDGTNSTWARFDGTETLPITLVKKTFRLSEGDSTVFVTGVQPVFRSRDTSATVKAQLDRIAVTLEASETPTFGLLASPQSETYEVSQADSTGFLPHQLAGRYFNATVAIPEISGRAIADLLGLAIRVEGVDSKER